MHDVKRSNPPTTKEKKQHQNPNPSNPKTYWEVDITVELAEGLHHLCESLTDSNIECCALCIV